MLVSPFVYNIIMANEKVERGQCKIIHKFASFTHTLISKSRVMAKTVIGLAV